jgi:hypothetical protein
LSLTPRDTLNFLKGKCLSSGPTLLTPLPSTTLALSYMVGQMITTPMGGVQFCMHFTDKGLEIPKLKDLSMSLKVIKGRFPFKLRSSVALVAEHILWFTSPGKKEGVRDGNDQHVSVSHSVPGTWFLHII